MIRTWTPTMGARVGSSTAHVWSVMDEAICNAHVVLDAFLLHSICKRYNFKYGSCKIKRIYLSRSAIMPDRVHYYIEYLGDTIVKTESEKLTENIYGGPQLCVCSLLN
jgi:hypothetical protein